ncbi:hypothetical protein [Fibrella forsythiae]|uniref:DUF4476 domain-containing protein n=1 Tax=Fibrella forsythiae TaxID=2817061 RepID=A0ABS3JRM4_9BACT|nr:hypothetical protein [Fibrella forsythiae]MBO0952668.1 hypothetical protein [Fibrella forsythiae]
MKLPFGFLSIFSFITLLFPIFANSQPLKSNSIIYLFSNKTKAELDSTINVSKLSIAESYSLIDTIYQVDKRYRDSLNRYNSGTTKFRYFISMIAINDAVNQKILLKVLRKYGWPCKKLQIADKASLIAWHSNLYTFQEFFSYINKCKDSINAGLYSQFEDRAKAFEKLRN